MEEHENKMKDENMKKNNSLSSNSNSSNSSSRSSNNNNKNNGNSNNYNGNSNSNNNNNNNNDDYIRNQRLITQNNISQQDEQLNTLGLAVDKLGSLGRDINQEIKEQTVILTKLDTDLDDAGNKMNIVMFSLSKLLKTKNNCQIYVIVMLMLILLFLIALIIWF